MKVKLLIFFFALLQLGHGYGQNNEESLLGIWKLCKDSLSLEQTKVYLKNDSYIKVFASDSTLVNLYWDDITSLVRLEKCTYEFISADRYVETLNKSTSTSELSNVDKEVWFDFRNLNMLRISYLLPEWNYKYYEYWQRISPPNLKKQVLPGDSIYSKVDCMPKFPGGAPALFAFITKNLRYPYEPFHEQRRVTVQFVVEKDGSLSHLRIVRSGGDLYFDKEVLRLVKSMPKFVPGLQNGNPVRVYSGFPVLFRLQ